MGRDVLLESRGLSVDAVRMLPSDQVGKRLFLLPSHVLRELEDVVYQRASDAIEEGGFNSDGDIGCEYLDDDPAIAELLNFIFDIKLGQSSFKVSVIFNGVEADNEEEAMQIVRESIGHTSGLDYDLEAEEEDE